MKQQPSRKLEFWFHLGIGILTIGIMFAMAGFISSQVMQSMLPWWVYPAFAVYVLVVLATDHALFLREEFADNKKSCQLPQERSSSCEVPAASFCLIEKTMKEKNNDHASFERP